MFFDHAEMASRVDPLTAGEISHLSPQLRSPLTIGKTYLRGYRISCYSPIGVEESTIPTRARLRPDDFDRLLKTDGDEQADDDGGDVDEEVAPGYWRRGEVGGRRASRLPYGGWGGAYFRYRSGAG
jgi:hypothetical protein